MPDVLSQGVLSHDDMNALLMAKAQETLSLMNNNFQSTSTLINEKRAALLNKRMGSTTLNEELATILDNNPEIVPNILRLAKTLAVLNQENKAILASDPDAVMRLNKALKA